MAIETKIQILIDLITNDARHPFPYKDCRYLLKKYHSQVDNLIPNLDLFWTDIAGYASWKHKIKLWPKEKTRQVQTDLGQSFFEKYPKYQILEAEITKEKTPALFDIYMTYEKMRKLLLEICDEQ